jgi:hypothetical protein
MFAERYTSRSETGMQVGYNRRQREEKPRREGGDRFSMWGVILQHAAIGARSIRAPGDRHPTSGWPSSEAV